MTLKSCFKCGTHKPRSAFYAHPQMADGLLGKCKDCTKADVRANREVTRAERHAYEQKRARDPKRRAKKVEYMRKHNAVHPEKAKARNAVSNAIRDGRLSRSPCRDCGVTSGVQAHHEDYSRPFDVQWLCFRCHRIEHGQHPWPF